MTLMDWLPAFPWEGPPLPRFLGVYWPQLQLAESLPTFPSRGYVTDVEEKPGTALVPSQAPASTYDNEESWQISWNSDGLPEKIVVHRNAKAT